MEFLIEKFKSMGLKGKIISVLAGIFIVCIIIASAGSSKDGSASKSSGDQPQVMRNLSLEIGSSVNILFSTYDIDIYLDNDKIGTVSNGNVFTSVQSVSNGSHRLRFSKHNDGTVDAYEKINVYSDWVFKCTLESKKDEIEVKNIVNCSATSLAETTTASEAQTEAASQPDNDFSGMNLPEAVKKVEDSGLTAVYLNALSKEDMHEKISKMSDGEKALWVISDFEEDSTIENFIKLYFKYTGDVKMPKVTGIKLSEALKTLRANEFSNIEYTSNNGKMIIITENWEVISQSAAEGSTCKADAQIVLTCKAAGTPQAAEDEEETKSSEKNTTKAASKNTTKAPAKTESNIPLGKRNAVDKAKSYLRFTAFSRKGLIEQLEYEGFSNDEAVYGADNSGADWNEQAALKAQSYLEFTSFSRQGLIEQLEYEGFSHAQAEYGVKSVGY